MGLSSLSLYPSFSTDEDWSQQSSQSSPGQRLLVAIVRRAIWDYVLYKDCDETSEADRYALALDAAGWLFWDGEESTDPEGRYTFLYICQLLDIDPKKIRKATLRLTREDIQKMNNNIKE